MGQMQKHLEQLLTGKVDELMHSSGFERVHFSYAIHNSDSVGVISIEPLEEIENATRIQVSNGLTFPGTLEIAGYNHKKYPRKPIAASSCQYYASGLHGIVQRERAELWLHNDDNLDHHRSFLCKLLSQIAIPWLLANLDSLTFRKMKLSSNSFGFRFADLVGPSLYILEGNESAAEAQMEKLFRRIIGKLSEDRRITKEVLNVTKEKYYAQFSSFAEKHSLKFAPNLQF
jgi:hypothetical protein